MKIKSTQDFGAGALFIAIGVIGIVAGRDLKFGSATNIGPGYFPTIVCVLIVAIGIIVLANSLILKGPAIDHIPLRPIGLISLALAAFGFLTAKTGVFVSSIVLIVLAAYAQRDPRPIETIGLAICTAVFVVVVFVYGLKQPLPVWWGA